MSAERQPACGQPGHVHERPHVEQLDETWIASFSAAALENQLMGARAGMNELEDTPLTLVMLGVRIAALLTRYMPELTEPLQLAVLRHAKVGKTDGETAEARGEAMDAPPDALLCGQYYLVQRANELIERHGLRRDA